MLLNHDKDDKFSRRVPYRVVEGAKMRLFEYRMTHDRMTHDSHRPPTQIVGKVNKRGTIHVLYEHWVSDDKLRVRCSRALRVDYEMAWFDLPREAVTCYRCRRSAGYWSGFGAKHDDLKMKW